MLQDLLAFNIPIEKSTVIADGCSFACDFRVSPATFNALSLLCVPRVLTMTCCRDFVFWSCLVFSASCVYRDVTLISLGEFSSMTLLKFSSAPWTRLFSLIYAYYWKFCCRCCFKMSHFSCMSFTCSLVCFIPIPCFFGLDLLLCLRVLIFYFLLDSFSLVRLFFEFPS